MSYLLRWALVGLVVWLVIRWLRAARSRQAGPSATLPLVRCSRCGVHLPERDAVRQGGNFYCSIAHRDEESR
jgi:uncharacterized protein